MADARRLTLRITGVAGAALFAFFFALTFHTPEWVEDFARDYLEAQVAKKVDATIDHLAPPRGNDALSRFAADLYRKNEASIADIKVLLKAKAREQLIDCIDQARALGAEQRRNISEWIEQGAMLSIGSLTLDNSRLVTLIQSGYLSVVGDLTHDIRIFTAVNASAFLLLVLISFLKPDSVRELFVPGVLLFVSTLLCSYLYVFGQNWLLTIIDGSYLGFAYAGYLGIVFLLLCDVWLNRARVTSAILESAASVLGAIVSPS